MTETFGQLLRRFRLRAGLAITELAEAIGADRGSVSAWECDRYMPRDCARLEDLAQALHLTPKELAALVSTRKRHGINEASMVSATAEPDHLPPEGAQGGTRCHQLRPPVADFVGRTAEATYLITALQKTLAAERGVVGCIQGMGGIGKTELAYLVAHHLHGTFPDAQIVLPLRGASTTPLSSAQALQTVIGAFSPEAKLPDDLDALESLYRSLLHEKRVLILADDARDATQVQSLVPPVGSALLITSRLRFTLPGMAAIDLEQLGGEDAVALLHAICPRLDRDTAQLLAQACAYLPLALRISAGLLRNNPALQIRTYLQRLSDERQRLSLLRDPDDARLDIEASLTQSYTQLDDTAQLVFDQLGVFVEDFPTELAWAVVEASVKVDVEAILHRLLRRNLLMYDYERGRWRLHDLVRSFALGRLEAAGVREAVQWRYAHAAVAIAQQTQDHYLKGGDQALAALAHFDVERPHIDAARRWAQAHTGSQEGDTLLVATARATHYLGGLRYDCRRERIPQLKQAQAAAQRLGDLRTEAQVLNYLGHAYEELGAIGSATSAYQEALTVARELGDRWAEGQTLNNLGNVYSLIGELRSALRYYIEALSVVHMLRDRRREGATLGNLGMVYVELGEIHQAIPLCEQALAIAREIGNPRSEGLALGYLGVVHLELDMPDQARHYFEAALAIFRRLGDQRSIGYTIRNLGRAAIDLGDSLTALSWSEEAMRIARDIGDQLLEGCTLIIIGRAYAAQQDMANTTRVFEQARALSDQAGSRQYSALCNWHYGLFLIEQGDRECALSLLRAAVGYEQEIGHAKAAEHAALVAHLESGGRAARPLIPSPADPAGRRPLTSRHHP